MDQLVIEKAPYINGQEIRDELTELYRQYQSQESKLRSGLLEKLNTLKQHAQSQAEQNLINDGDGRRCAEGLSLFQDELIRIIYDFTTQHIYRATNPTSAERIAIVATGGYGRGALAPGSDIDLLFLLPYKQTAWGESVIEYMLYLMWDMGFKVGHATRSVEQSVRFAKSDMTIRTALLDSRYLWGAKELYDEFIAAFDEKVVAGTAREFIEAKLQERSERHDRPGISRYMVEPNIKEGKGGQRDLHTLHWIAKYLTFNPNETDLSASGIFSDEEFSSFKRCDDFLWTIRCHLHFLTKRPEERISFDVQKSMAERLGYADRKAMQAVERFMKHYFLIAKEVGNLTRILCADLEMKQLKATPKLNDFLENLNWRRRTELKNSTDFCIENGRLNVAHKDTFRRDPVNLLKIFAIAAEYNALLHPSALRLIRQSIRLVDDKLRSNPRANKIFLELLSSKHNAAAVLRKLNEVGVLGQFIPEFGQIVSMMQFNMYHHFTVDEHLIRTVGELSEIDLGESAKELPLSHEIMKNVKNPRILYVAAFLHDIAKGRKEDHSIAGARDARVICPRLGLDENETEDVAWLIQEHLTMSQYAQSRDLNDPQTINDFAKIVQSRDRLNMLIILTACDIRSVGPGTWNGWKGQLLRTLYHNTDILLSGGHPTESAAAEAKAAVNLFKESLDGWSENEIDQYTSKHYDSYWLKTDLETQQQHAALVKKSEQEKQGIAFEISSDAFTAHTAITIYTPAHPNLLAIIAGSCAANGADIIDAHVTTTQDGMAIDTVYIKREFEQADDERRRGENITNTVEKLIRGECHLNQLLAGKRGIKGRIKAFNVTPDVTIDNSISNHLTVIEVHGLDRPGLLYDLTSTLGELNLDISSAHIATYGEKAVDVFYVTDLLGAKISSEQRQKQISDRITKILIDAEEPEMELAHK